MTTGLKMALLGYFSSQCGSLLATFPQARRRPPSEKSFLLSHSALGIVATELQLLEGGELGCCPSGGLSLAELFHNLGRAENPPNLNAKPAS